MVALVGLTEQGTQPRQNRGQLLIQGVEVGGEQLGLGLPELDQGMQSLAHRLKLGLAPRPVLLTADAVNPFQVTQPGETAIRISHGGPRFPAQQFQFVFGAGGHVGFQSGRAVSSARACAWRAESSCCQ